VRVAAPDGRSLGGEIARIRVAGPDPADPERAVGGLLGMVDAPAVGRGLRVVPFPA
jgi:hypothetical protein